jgi:hypothetical protein
MTINILYGFVRITNERVNNQVENICLDAVVTSSSGLAKPDSVHYGYTEKGNGDILSSTEL